MIILIMDNFREMLNDESKTCLTFKTYLQPQILS